MNKQIKYSLLIMLAIAMITGLAKAQTPAIGTSTQTQPWESPPTSHTAGAGMTVVGAWTNAYDGSLLAPVSFWGTGTATTTNVVFKWLTASTPPEAWSIGWLDLKISYSFPGTTTNTYRIEYSITGTTWTIIQAATTAKFDNGGLQGNRPFVNLARPGGGAWTWADINNLQVRFFITRVGATWEAKKLNLYEVWLTVYQNAPPTGTGPVVSVQPPSVLSVAPLNGFFVDIYIRNVASLWGYQFTMHYDTNVLTASEYFSYYIFDTAAVSYIDDANGIVSVSYTSYGGDLVGFTGDMPLARIYFMVDGGGATKLDIPAAESILSDTVGTAIAHTVYGGWFSTSIIMSLQPPTVLPVGANPIGTQWHELYPHYSHMYTLTSWLDNGDLDLSPSDQIDMVNETGFKYWFHVDLVTLTIHWTFKAPDTGTAEAEIDVPTREFTQITAPIGTRWHQVHGPSTPGTTDTGYCRWFTITSWTDNGNGYLDPSDQFDFLYDDEYVDVTPGPTHWAHLDAVSTDIFLSQKGIPEPPVPEFPLGLGLVLAAAPMIPIIHLWRTKRRVMKK